MMASIDYLISGTWQGIIALILFIFGITLFSLSQISIQKNASFSGRDQGFSNRVLGSAFMLAALLVVFVTLVLGNQPITSEQYQQAMEELDQIPQLKPIIAAQIKRHPKLTRIDYFNFQNQVEAMKQQMYIREIKVD